MALDQSKATPGKFGDLFSRSYSVYTYGASAAEVLVVGVVRFYWEALPPGAASVYGIHHHTVAVNLLQINGGHQRQGEYFCERHSTSSRLSLSVAEVRQNRAEARNATRIRRLDVSYIVRQFPIRPPHPHFVTS